MVILLMTSLVLYEMPRHVARRGQRQFSVY